MKNSFNNYLPNGEAYDAAADFLKKTIQGFAKGSIRHLMAVSEVPYTYSEPALGSLFAPVLSSIGTTFMMEYPLKRTGKVEREHGRLDYWCRYNWPKTTDRQFDMMMEVKQHLIAIDHGHVQKDPTNGWNYPIKQAESTSKEGAFLSQYSSAAIPIALHVLPIAFPGVVSTTYSASKFSKELKQLHDLYSVSGIKTGTKPNWSCLSVMTDIEAENLTVPDKSDGKKKSYFAVLFNAYIGKPITYSKK